MNNRPFAGWERIGEKTGGANPAGENGGVYTNGSVRALFKQDSKDGRVLVEKNISEVFVSQFILRMAARLGISRDRIAACSFARVGEQSGVILSDPTGENTYVKSVFIKQYDSDLWQYALKAQGLPIPAERPSGFGGLLPLEINKVVSSFIESKPQLMRDLAELIVLRYWLKDLGMHPGNFGMANDRVVALDWGTGLNHLSAYFDPESSIDNLGLAGVHKNHALEYSEAIRKSPIIGLIYIQASRTPKPQIKTMVADIIENELRLIERFKNEDGSPGIALKRFCDRIGMDKSDYNQVVRIEELVDKIRGFLEDRLSTRRKSLYLHGCRLVLNHCQLDGRFDLIKFLDLPYTQEERREILRSLMLFVENRGMADVVGFSSAFCCSAEKELGYYMRTLDQPPQTPSNLTTPIQFLQSCLFIEERKRTQQREPVGFHLSRLLELVGDLQSAAANKKAWPDTQKQWVLIYLIQEIINAETVKTKPDKGYIDDLKMALSFIENDSALRDRSASAESVKVINYMVKAKALFAVREDRGKEENLPLGYERFDTRVFEVIRMLGVALGKGSEAEVEIQKGNALAAVTWIFTNHAENIKPEEWNALTSLPEPFQQLIFDVLNNVGKSDIAIRYGNKEAFKLEMARAFTDAPLYVAQSNSPYTDLQTARSYCVIQLTAILLGKDENRLSFKGAAAELLRWIFTEKAATLTAHDWSVIAKSPPEYVACLVGILSANQQEELIAKLMEKPAMVSEPVRQHLRESVERLFSANRHQSPPAAGYDGSLTLGMTLIHAMAAAISEEADTDKTAKAEAKSVLQWVFAEHAQDISAGEWHRFASLPKAFTDFIVLSLQQANQPALLKAFEQQLETVLLRSSSSSATRTSSDDPQEGSLRSDSSVSVTSPRGSDRDPDSDRESSPRGSASSTASASPKEVTTLDVLTFLVCSPEMEPYWKNLHSNKNALPDGISEMKKICQKKGPSVPKVEALLVVLKNKGAEKKTQGLFKTRDDNLHLFYHEAYGLLKKPLGLSPGMAENFRKRWEEKQTSKVSLAASHRENK